MRTYPRIASLKSPEDFLAHAAALGVQIPLDPEMQAGPEAPLAQPYHARGYHIGNRFAVLPMEGWDGTTEGRPTEETIRRWRRFGASGAKLVWGGEAVAVRPDGRANPQQLMILPETLGDLSALRETLVGEHQQQFGNTDDLLIGLQLTHSGRFARPIHPPHLRPIIAYRHPLLDRKFAVPDDHPVLTDDEIDRLVEDFVRAAVLAKQAGFAFVDVKHCHGYLGHEFLSAVDRPGKYGGSLENRTRFLRTVVEGIRSQAPGLQIGVRLSAMDWLPFRPGADGFGEPESYSAGHYPYAFGGDGTGLGVDLTEPHALLDLLEKWEIRLVCITVGSPYYNPHIQRPALFPPSDGYMPPEDPLAGVSRQLAVTAELKARHPELAIVGSGYSYLQDWLPNVAQAAVRTGGVDFVGLGRMMLSYPDLPANVLAGRPLQRKYICRTFSDCTTAPRNGMISGCYPLDDYYRARPEAKKLALLKGEDKPPRRQDAKTPRGTK